MENFCNNVSDQKESIKEDVIICFKNIKKKTLTTLKKKINLKIKVLERYNPINYKNGYLEYNINLNYKKYKSKKNPFHRQILLNELYPIREGKNLAIKVILKTFSDDIIKYILDISSDTTDQKGRDIKPKLTKKHVLDFFTDLMNGFCPQLDFNQLQSVKRQCGYQINLFNQKEIKKRKDKDGTKDFKKIYRKVFVEEHDKYISGKYNENDFDDFLL